MAEFKDIFREGRNGKGLQQKDLAKMIGVVPAYISRMEKGFSLPSNNLIIKICAELELDVANVFFQVLLEKTDENPIRKIISDTILLLSSEGMRSEDTLMAQKIAQLEPEQKKVVIALLDTLQSATPLPRKGKSPSAGVPALQ